MDISNYIKEWAKIISESSEDTLYVDEEKKEFHLKDKDQTYKPEQNKYAFKNRTDSYGGDDYITTNDILDRVDERISSKFGGHNWFKGSEKLDSHNSYIYVKIDDGKDTTLAIKDIVKSEKNPRIVYVQTTDGEGMKSVDFGSKLSDMMYFLGRTIKGYLVIMNKSDESVYICNKIETKDNDVILSFEWGDLVDFSEELKENQNKQFMKTDVSESVIKDILDNSRIENKRFNRSQFSKYFGLKEINWCVLYENEEPMAIAAVHNDYPFKDYYYIDEIQNLRKGYGKPLIKEIISKYHKVWLMANPEAEDTLRDYYRDLGLEEIRVDNSVYGCTAYFFCSKECDYDKLENYCIGYYANDKEDEINEDVVDDTNADMKKVKSTNKENSDTKKTMNHTSSKTLTLMIDADKVNKENRIVDVIVREDVKEAEKDIGGEKSDIADELQGMKIWIDDVREAPEGFKWFKTVNDFIDWCYRKQDLSDVALIDTDHDAGEMQEFGGDYIVCFKYLSACNCKNLTIHIHSANPVGANNIRSIIHSNEENGWKEIRNS